MKYKRVLTRNPDLMLAAFERVVGARRAHLAVLSALADRVLNVEPAPAGWGRRIVQALRSAYRACVGKTGDSDAT